MRSREMVRDPEMKSSEIKTTKNSTAADDAAESGGMAASPAAQFREFRESGEPPAKSFLRRHKAKIAVVAVLVILVALLFILGGLGGGRDLIYIPV